MSTLTAWATDAVNLPEHASNPIHTDEGARAAGFEAAIVAGTTVYAYLTHVPAAAWGEAWLAGGGGELRLRQPVLDRERVECSVLDEAEAEAASPVVAACVSGEPRATLEVWRTTTPPAPRPGEVLPPLEVTLTDELGGYGVRAGDDLAIYEDLGVAHPALWPSLANQVFADHLVEGAWIHTRSRIHHRATAAIGAQLTVVSTVVDRFATRAGERAVADIEIIADGRPVVQIEHEALVKLAPSS